MRYAKSWKCVGLSLAVVLSLCDLVTPVAPGGGNNPGVMPVNSKPYGHSYAEWSARHWQWLFSLPASTHPLFGDDNDPSQGQSGQVWFLGGTFSSIEIEPGIILGVANRNITIRTGTALFFPIIDTESSQLEGNGDTEQELRDSAEFNADFIVPDSLFCVVDGRAVKNPTQYGVESPLFTYGPLPADNVFADPVNFPEGATSIAVSDGYFIMLAPLSVGRHTLHFGGVSDYTSIGGPVFIQDITYTITVAPPRK
jgi:hypothetical protein